MHHDNSINLKKINLSSDTHFALLKEVDKSMPSHKFSIVIFVCTFEDNSRFACSAAAFNLKVSLSSFVPILILTM